MFLLNGCVESIALLGPSIGGVSNGKMLQSSLSSAVSYGVKTQTGKGPLEHVRAYAEKANPERKKETCVSFLERRLILTKSKIKFLDSDIKPEQEK